MKGLKMAVDVQVLLTGREWQIYSLDKDPTPEQRGRYMDCVMALNEAASKALSCGDRNKARTIFDAARDRYADMGAADSEPRWKFEEFLERVYGTEDEYIDPTCDECGVSTEDALEWCGNCGNCKDHCANFEGCDDAQCCCELCCSQGHCACGTGNEPCTCESKEA
jgi:hypothetical protein